MPLGGYKGAKVEQTTQQHVSYEFTVSA